MRYLLDTCVISELVRVRPDAKVVAWIQSQREEDLFISVLSFGEIEKGIEKVQDESRKTRLKLWVEEDLKKRFAGRILVLDLDVALQWGKAQGKAALLGIPMPAIDGLIAATGFVHNCNVVTRNTGDMEQSGVELIDPWEG